MTPLEFVVISLAVWRVSRIIAMEDGPFNVFDAIRLRLKVHEGRTWIQKGIVCIGCISFWVGMLAAVAFVDGPWWGVILHGLAFSAVSVILMRRVN